MADFKISGEHSGNICPQCKALFKYPNIPKSLPNCSHVYCVICLRRIFEDEIYSSEIKCPQCQAEIPIQEAAEIDELETNEEHMRLADTRNLLEQTGTAELTMREKTTQLQVEVQETTGSVHGACVATEAKLYKKCQIHTGEDIVYYCLTCDERICLKCVVPKHLNHDVKDFEEAHSVLQKRIQEKLQVASKHAEIWKQKTIGTKGQANCISDIFGRRVRAN